MRGKLVTTTCGLALAVALGIPAAAQATVTGPGPADARTAATAADATLSCAVMDDLGDNAYGGWDNFQGIYFGYGLSHAIPWCNVNRGGGHFWIEEEVNGQLSGQCLIADSTGAFEFPCSDSATAHTDWTATRVGYYHSQSIWVLKNSLSGVCLYDDIGIDPAFATTCNNSDRFEHFIWDALP
jgi:hypothetical protein